MFFTRKIQLGALLCGAILLGSASYLHAQDNFYAPAKTPEAAAQRFYRLLDSVSEMRQNQARRSYSGDVYYHFDLGAIARAQLQNFRNSGALNAIEMPESLLVVLAHEKDAPQLETRVTGKDGDQTLVEVVPVPAKKREIVVIPEDGGYRVDLKATLGRWNDLSGEELDLAWFQYTGIESPSLVNNATFQRAQENKRRSSCQSQLKQQALGVMQYAQDWDEQLPPARHWIDVLQPYTKSEEIFQCPSLAAAGRQGYGYAFNQYLSQKNQNKIADSVQTVLIYETSNPARNWFGPGTGREYRHLGGSNIAFADGHVKWFLQGKEVGVQFKP